MKCVLDILIFTIALLYLLYLFHRCAILTYIRTKDRAKYATLLHCRTGQKYGLKSWPHKTNRTLPYLCPLTLNFLKMEEFLNNKSQIQWYNWNIIRADIFLGKLLRNSKNIRAYFMLNHRIRCIYFLFILFNGQFWGWSFCRRDLPVRIIFVHEK